MKKIITLLFILVAAVVWWKQTPPSAVTVSSPKATRLPEEILADDYKKMTATLNPENISGDEWAKINDYSIKAEVLVNKENAAQFFKTAKNNLPDLFSCLKKDFCGMETRGEHDPYFDEERTPAHILINRNLKVMKESLLEDKELAALVDWELMQELAASNAEMLSAEALEILREFNPEVAKTDQMLEMTKDSKGSVKAENLMRIAKNAKGADKLLIANEIEEVFAVADANTAISVLESMKKMAFNSQELRGRLKNLCKFKVDEDIKHNWYTVKYEANKIDPEFEKSCN